MNEYERLRRLAERHKQAYPPGTRLELIDMNDPYAPVPSGTRGTVKFIDDMAQIQKLFFKWGISFDEKHPYEIPDQGNRKVEYAEKKDILDGIVKKYRPDLLEPPTPVDDDGGMLGNQEQQMTEKNEPNPAKPQNRDRRRNGGAAVQTAPRNRRNPMPEVSQEQEAPSDGQT